MDFNFLENSEAAGLLEEDTFGLAGKSDTMLMSNTPGDDEHMGAAEEVTESQTEEDSN